VYIIKVKKSETQNHIIFSKVTKMIRLFVLLVIVGLASCSHFVCMVRSQHQEGFFDFGIYISGTGGVSFQGIMNHVPDPHQTILKWSKDNWKFEFGRDLTGIIITAPGGHWGTYKMQQKQCTGARFAYVSSGCYDTSGWGYCSENASMLNASCRQYFEDVAGQQCR